MDSPFLSPLAGKNNVKKSLPQIIEGKQLWSFGQCESGDGFPLSQQAVVRFLPATQCWNG